MTSGDDLGFVHQFVARSSPAEEVSLLLLHGTGGTENDLIPLGRRLLPGAALLSPRGKVLENGMPRFFRRFAEGVFDVEDLRLQTGALAKFVREAAAKYRLASDKLLAIGYSNGANIAASLLLTDPSLLAGAVLFRPMVPFVPKSPPDLRNRGALLTAGRRDPIVTPEQTFTLAEILENAGASVSIHWHDGGHELGNDDLLAAQTWITKWRTGRSI